MSILDQDNSPCYSNPVKIEVKLEECWEEATSAEVFVKEESPSSCSSDAAEPAWVSQELDIKPYDAVSVKFDNETYETYATPKLDHTATNSCTMPVSNWPVLEIKPGGFVSNNTTLDEDFTTPLHTPSDITDINDPLHIEETYLEKPTKMYSCAKCDESFDVMFQLTKHVNTHLPNHGRKKNNIKLNKRMKKNEERLILCVRAQRCLWDKSSLEYKDMQAKEKAWREVTKQCRISNIHDAKEKWKQFRMMHRSMVRRGILRSGGTSKQWMYMDIMQFLLPSYSNTKKSKPPEVLDDESFIRSIRARPCLWDSAPCCGQRTEGWEHHRAKELAWLEVIKECNIYDVITAKNKWSNLRNIHRDVLKQERSEGAPEVKWKYTRSMQFLPPYRQNTKTRSQSPSIFTRLRILRM